jgi:hypothetical protein
MSNLDGMELAPLPNSKIKMYALDEFVAECYVQGMNNNRIATLCNKKLQKMKDEKKIDSYIDINAQNVKVYLEVKLKEKEFLPISNENLSIINKQAINISKEMESQRNIISYELDKLRDPENPVAENKQAFFIDLLAQYGKLLELAAEVQGKIQPSISIGILSANMTKLIDRIQKHSEIPENIKSIVCTMISDEILNDALKSVKGQETNG